MPTLAKIFRPVTRNTFIVLSGLMHTYLFPKKSRAGIAIQDFSLFYWKDKSRRHWKFGDVTHCMLGNNVSCFLS